MPQTPTLPHGTAWPDTIPPPQPNRATTKARSHAIHRASRPIDWPTPSVSIDPANGQRHKRPGHRPASSATRRTASVSWLVNACRAQPTHNRLIQPAQFLDFCSAPSDHPRRPQPADVLATPPPCGSRHTFAWFSLRSQLARNIFPPNLTLGCRVYSFEPTHSYKSIGWRNIDPANGQRQLAGERVPGATDSQSPDTARVIPQFHSVPSDHPRRLQPAGCAGHASTMWAHATPSPGVQSVSRR